jgi:arsenite oxidase small subunit
MEKKMDRRRFLKVMGAVTIVAVAPSTITQTLYADDGSLYKTYDKVKLVDNAGNPIKASMLKKETDYVFMYPFMGTPCLLVDIGEATNKDVKLKSEDGKEYIFKGGVGKNNSIVAVSAMCQHQLTHPNPKESFLNYVPKNKKTMACKCSGVFVCSSHMSAYDAKNGSNIIAGPATQGLPNIVLEVENDEIWAVGVLGPERFHDYFKFFKSEFKETYGNWRKAKKKVKGESATMLLSEYSKDIIVY